MVAAIGPVLLDLLADQVLRRNGIGTAEHGRFGVVTTAFMVVNCAFDIPLVGAVHVRTLKRAAGQRSPPLACAFGAA